MFAAKRLCREVYCEHLREEDDEDPLAEVKPAKDIFDPQGVSVRDIDLTIFTCRLPMGPPRPLSVSRRTKERKSSVWLGLFWSPSQKERKRRKERKGREENKKKYEE